MNNPAEGLNNAPRRAGTSGQPDVEPVAMRPAAVNASLTPSRPNGRRRRLVENSEYVGFLERTIRAAGRRIAAGDIEGLADLMRLSGELETAMQTAVTGLRQFGYSWSEVGRVAGMTKQSAHQRWSATGSEEAQ